MTSARERASTTRVAVDARTTDHAGAEHLVRLLDDLLPATDPTYVASTHVVTGARPHTAVAASWSSVAPTGADPEQLASQIGALLGADPALVAVVVSGATDPRSAGPEDLVAGAFHALAEHRARSTGRLARYPGREDIERRCTVADVLATSAVDSVDALSGTRLTADTELDLSEWARPVWRDGAAVLLVQLGQGGLVPFESRHQIPCCSQH